MTTLSAAADPTTTQRAADGRFVKAAASPVPTPPPNAPSTTVDYGQQRGPATVDAPSPTDDYGSEPVKPP